MTCNRCGVWRRGAFVTVLTWIQYLHTNTFVYSSLLVPHAIGESSIFPNSMVLQIVCFFFALSGMRFGLFATNASLQWTLSSLSTSCQSKFVFLTFWAVSDPLSHISFPLCCSGELCEPPQKEVKEEENEMSDESVRRFCYESWEHSLSNFLFSSLDLCVCILRVVCFVCVLCVCTFFVQV